MKRILHKTMSFVMAIVVLLSTMSFTMNMHYCGDVLVETAIFQKAKGCGMEMDQPSNEGCSVTKKNCCDDKQFAVEGQDELQFHVEKITFEQQLFISSFIWTYIDLFEGLENNVTTQEVYKPPLVIRRLYKIDETYLI